MKFIQSTQNDTVKHLVKLQAASCRKKERAFLAQGYTVCTTLIEQKYTLHGLYCTEQALQKYDLNSFNKQITTVSEQVMKKISTSTTPSGIVGLFQMPEISYTPTNNAVVLYNIQDPGNLGTIIRTAAAMNITNVFIIEGVDPYSPKVIQATAGTIGYVQIIETTWHEFMNNHQSFTTSALVVNQGLNPDNSVLAESIIIIGNEGQGLPQDIVESCSQQITLPMPGNTESLNAAVAGSIALYIKSNKL